MLSNAALAAYCIFSICEPDDPAASDELAPAVAQSSFASPVALAVFAVIALLCLLEACRCWLRAANTPGGGKTMSRRAWLASRRRTRLAGL